MQNVIELCLGEIWYRENVCDLFLIFFGKMLFSHELIKAVALKLGMSQFGIQVLAVLSRWRALVSEVGRRRGEKVLDPALQAIRLHFTDPRGRLQFGRGASQATRDKSMLHIQTICREITAHFNG